MFFLQIKNILASIFLNCERLIVTIFRTFWTNNILFTYLVRSVHRQKHNHQNHSLLTAEHPWEQCYKSQPKTDSWYDVIHGWNCINDTMFSVFVTIARYTAKNIVHFPESTKYLWRVWFKDGVKREHFRSGHAYTSVFLWHVTDSCRIIQRDLFLLLIHFQKWTGLTRETGTDS
jgi:hypothetical protein